MGFRCGGSDRGVLWNRARQRNVDPRIALDGQRLMKSITTPSSLRCLYSIATPSP
jgi:hypothetical protein